MEIELSQKTIDAIARRTAIILAKKMKEKEDDSEMVSTAEAARILKIKPQRMREIAGRFPHVKQGENKQGKLLFKKSALLENY